MRTHRVQRLDYLDMVKGIGIILVVLGHSTYAGENLLTWIASFHMPLFFIVSGMLLQYTNEEEKSMKVICKKKMKSIMLPYFSFTIIYLIMDGLLMALHIGSKTWIAFFYEMVGSITLFGISTLWFLPALFFGEIVFLYIRKKKSHILTIGIGIFFAVVIGLTHSFFDTNYPLYNAIYYLIPGYFIIFLYRSAAAYIFILLGYYVKGFLKEENKVMIKEIALGVACLLAGMAIAFANGRVDLHSVVFKNNIYFYTSAFTGTMGIVLLCKNFIIVIKYKLLNPLLAAGRNSLIIMATHLEFKVMLIAIRGAAMISGKVPVLMPYMQWILVAILVALMECVIVYMLNHYFYFIIGKARPVNKKRFKVIK